MPAGGHLASCTVTVTPLEVGSGSHRASQGTAQLQVAEGGQAGQPPNTTLKQRPRKKTASRKARFRFVSDQPGSTFQCKLDRKPFKPCHSPLTKKLPPGRHAFTVRAVNSAGTADPTPAVFRWKVE
jgi:hypothetical protein